MANRFNALKTWARNTFQTLKAIEGAVDYHYEDHAQERFTRLERRVALLEQQLVLSGRKPS